MLSANYLEYSFWSILGRGENDIPTKGTWDQKLRITNLYVEEIKWPEKTMDILLILFFLNSYMIGTRRSFSVFTGSSDEPARPGLPTDSDVVVLV